MRRAPGNDFMKGITLCAVGLIAACLPFNSAKAQARTDANCTYETCALGIAPGPRGDQDPTCVDRSPRGPHAGDPVA